MMVLAGLLFDRSVPLCTILKLLQLFCGPSMAAVQGKLMIGEIISSSVLRNKKHGIGRGIRDDKK